LDFLQQLYGIYDVILCAAVYSKERYRQNQKKAAVLSAKSVTEAGEAEVLVKATDIEGINYRTGLKVCSPVTFKGFERGLLVFRPQQGKQASFGMLSLTYDLTAKYAVSLSIQRRTHSRRVLDLCAICLYLHYLPKLAT
jgi:hypothetical protein